MLHAAWKSILGRKLRLMLSAFSIVLGVAFVSGSLIFTSLLSSSVEGLLKGQFADVNVAVEALGGTTQGTTAPALITLQPGVVDQISRLDGVVQATGVVNSFAVYPMVDGKVLAFQGAPGMGSSFHTTPAVGGLEGLHVVEGAAPQADDEVALDPATLARGGFGIGQQIEVSTPFNGIQTYKVTGTASYGAGGNAGATYLFFTLHEAQRLFVGGQDVFTGIWVAATPGSDVEALRSDVAGLVPPGFRAATGQQLADEFTEQLNVGLSFVNTFLMVFAAIALLVAALLVWNTFSILVAQRSRELALLRALGAKRSQVRDAVLFEAVVVGLAGATAGIAGGWLLCWAIIAALGVAGMDMGVGVPSLTWQAVVASYVLALVITVLAALVPARRASATRPVEAMSEAAATGPQAPNEWGVMIGFGLLQLGAAAIVCGLWLNVPGPLYWVGIGSAAVLVGMVLTAAVMGRPVVWLATRLYRRLFGEVGRLAGLNAARQPRRTAATAATLMIGLALVTTVAILADSTTTSIRAGVTENQRGDFVISPVNYQPFDRTVADRAAAIDGVADVWTFARSGTVVDGTTLSVLGTSPQGLTDGSALKVLAGQLGADDNSVMLSFDASKKLGLPMGKTFQVPTITGGVLDVLVTGIFQDSTGSAVPTDMVVNPATYPKLGDARTVNEVKVKLAEGADAAAVRKALDDATSGMPTVVVTDNAQYADALVGRFQQLFSIVYALLALAVVISVLGIVNTLGLSVFERTREIGLLRAVGLTRPQLRRMVTLESLTVAAMGAVLGVVLGLVFGVVLVVLLRDSGITDLAVPWLQVLLFLVLAVGLGIVAAITPARRAARLDVLDAVAAE